MSDRRYLKELSEHMQGQQGNTLKQRYGGETPEQRQARKRQEYMEETGDEMPAAYVPNGTMPDAKRAEAARAVVPPAAPAEASLMEQIAKLMGLR